MPHELNMNTGAEASPALALSVNGERVASAAPTLAALLVERGFDGGAGAFACAVNGQFVPRASWAAQTLAAGDRIDVVAPVTGG
jgi:sulfur carrier protein